MKKKILSIFLIISILSITACTSKEEDIEAEDITIEQTTKRNEYKRIKDEDYVGESEEEEDKYSNYPYNIEEAEDASGYVYPENLIASRDWGADETDEMAEYLMNTVPDEDIELKQLIALVILNRVWTPEFPTTVPEVIEDLKREKNIEYTDGLEITYECYEAIGNIQYEGWNESQDALYYILDTDIETKNYYDENYKELFTYDKYTFYK